jgi:hypothetical protein
MFASNGRLHSGSLRPLRVSTWNIAATLSFENEYICIVL